MFSRIKTSKDIRIGGKYIYRYPFRNCTTMIVEPTERLTNDRIRAKIVKIFIDDTEGKMFWWIYDSKSETSMNIKYLTAVEDVGYIDKYEE